jgi:hypothetical protein
VPLPRHCVCSPSHLRHHRVTATHNHINEIIDVRFRTSIRGTYISLCAIGNLKTKDLSEPSCFVQVQDLANACKVATKNNYLSSISQFTITYKKYLHLFHNNQTSISQYLATKSSKLVYTLAWWSAWTEHGGVEARRCAGAAVGVQSMWGAAGMGRRGGGSDECDGGVVS